MIITLQGILTYKDASFVVLEVQGVGYEIHANVASFGPVPVGSIMKLWIHEHLRDDAHDLYGFGSASEHHLFRRLVSVSGVGPKTALHIFSLGSVADIERVIERGDIARLSSVSGIGKKTAQKIILELKGKLVDAGGGEDDELVTALVNLGYSREKARLVLSRVPAGVDDRVEHRLKAALRELGK